MEAGVAEARHKLQAFMPQGSPSVLGTGRRAGLDTQSV